MRETEVDCMVYEYSLTQTEGKKIC